MASSDDEEYSSLDDEEAALDMDEEELEGEEEGVDLRDMKQPREPIFNTTAIHDKLEDISWTGVPWDEAQAITSPVPEVEDVDDDLTRELAFYNQALEAARQATARFEEAGTPWFRPADYYAEMVKSDQHMAKVKEQLIFEEQQIAAAEQRRKQRENKRFSKQVQVQRRVEKARETKANITTVSKLRKQRQKSGFEGELDVDKELERMNRKNTPHKPGERIRVDGRGPGKKRQARDSKYGFGGRKRLGKQNDAVSAASGDFPSPGSRGRGRGGGGGGGRARGGSIGGRGNRGGARGAGSGVKGRGPIGGVSKRDGAPGSGRGGNRPGKARRAASRTGK